MTCTQVFDCPPYFILHKVRKSSQGLEKWTWKCQFSSLPHCITHEPPPHLKLPSVHQHFWVSCWAFRQLKALPTPMSEHICVLHIFTVAVFGVDPALSLSIFFCMYVSVCITCMSLWGCVLHASVSVTNCNCVCMWVSYPGITGCWAVLSVDSVVSFGPAAPSNAGWSDEIWQTGTVLSRALPHPIISPIMARLLQGHRRRLRELSHMLTNDSEMADTPIHQSYETLLFSNCLLGLHAGEILQSVY